MSIYHPLDDADKAAIFYFRKTLAQAAKPRGSAAAYQAFAFIPGYPLTPQHPPASPPHGFVSNVGVFRAADAALDGAAAFLADLR